MRIGIGAEYKGQGKCEFVVWAPNVRKLSLSIVSGNKRSVEMAKDSEGYFRCSTHDTPAGTEYFFRIDDKQERPDPASFYQPKGVFGPSAVVDHAQFSWSGHKWVSPPLREMIFYELHIGTFSPEGTFDGAANLLDHLCDLGINAIEIMPVAQFSGERNWGYDGVYPFAAQNSYGGPDGLKRLVDACHKKGIAVILDVVYNHLGPEGNFLPEFMPCFTDKYHSPWGKAINFDDTYSCGVREYFIRNALYWFEQYHVDGLRLDAIHGIFDMSARHFLRELSQRVEEFSKAKGRKSYLIAESDLNDARVVRPPEQGGYGIDAQWNDDFHHCLHTLLTKDRKAYYEDFGAVTQLAKAIREGFVYSWEYSRFRKRFHGSSSADIPAGKFVVFSQNHDQVGNRPNGERLPVLTSFEGLKLAAAVTMFSANVPLLFMGEEYGEDAPFFYFMSFQDKGLIEAVRRGREREFACFCPGERPQDPYDEKTFLSSKLDMDKASEGRHRVLFDLYKELIRIRKTSPVLSRPDKDGLKIEADDENGILQMTRANTAGHVYAAANFSDKECSFRMITHGGWLKVFDSSESQWLGPGPLAPQAIEQGQALRLAAKNLVLYSSGQKPGPSGRNE